MKHHNEELDQKLIRAKEKLQKAELEFFKIKTEREGEIVESLLRCLWVINHTIWEDS